MRKSFLIALILFTSVMSAFAGECEIKVVQRDPYSSMSLRPHIEKILREKGYTTVDDGLLYEDYNVRVDQLKVREDLFQPGNLVGIVDGEFGVRDSDMCTKWISGHVTCAFKFHLIRVKDESTYNDIAITTAEVKERPTFFRSEKKITNLFYKKVIAQARNFPNCKP